MKENNDYIEYASNQLLNDRQFMLEAIDKNGLYLRLASDELKNDKNLLFKLYQIINNQFNMLLKK